MLESNAIARPYAKAIFALAKEENQMTKWSEMMAFAKQIASSSSMREVLHSPQLSVKERIAIFCDLGQTEFSDTAKKVIRVLGEAGRLAFFPEIADFFEGLRKEHEKVVEVQVVSAFLLDEEDKKRLMNVLEKRFEANILLSCEVDSGLIGGAVVRAGNFVLDGSVKGRLAQITKAIVLTIS